MIRISGFYPTRGQWYVFNIGTLRTTVSRVQARYITDCNGGQAVTLHQQAATVPMFRLTGCAGSKGQSAEQAKRPAGAGRCAGKERCVTRVECMPCLETAYLPCSRLYLSSVV